MTRLLNRAVGCRTAAKSHQRILTVMRLGRRPARMVATTTAMAWSALAAANEWSTLIIYLYLDSDRMYVWRVGLTRQKDCDGEGVSHHEILRIVSLLEHSIISCLFVPCRADFDCRTGKDTKTQCQKTETGRECYDNRDNDKVRLASSLRCTFA